MSTKAATTISATFFFHAAWFTTAAAITALAGYTGAVLDTIGAAFAVAVIAAPITAAAAASCEICTLAAAVVTAVSIEHAVIVTAAPGAQFESSLETRKTWLATKTFAASLCAQTVDTSSTCDAIGTRSAASRTRTLAKLGAEKTPRLAAALWRNLTNAGFTGAASAARQGRQQTAITGRLKNTTSAVGAGERTGTNAADVAAAVVATVPPFARTGKAGAFITDQAFFTAAVFATALTVFLGVGLADSIATYRRSNALTGLSAERRAAFAPMVAATLGRCCADAFFTKAAGATRLGRFNKTVAQGARQAQAAFRNTALAAVAAAAFASAAIVATLFIETVCYARTQALDAALLWGNAVATAASTSVITAVFPMTVWQTDTKTVHAGLP